MEEPITTNTTKETSQPVQTPITNPVEIDEKPKKNSGLAIILSFTTIIATLIAGFFYFQNTQLKSKLQENLSSPIPTTTPDQAEDWRTYTDSEFKFSFQYPKDAILEKSECISLQIIGPTQTNDTEPFDGLYLSICPETLENETLDDWIKNDLFQALEIVEPKAKIEIQEYEAYSYKITGELMTEKHTVIQSPLSKSQIILISDITKDPTNQNYEEKVNKIISSFKFLDNNEESKVTCTSPRPEVCTEECIINPPYICGSDGKSYCTICQACANENVEWYISQDTSCTKE